ncbi:HNH endonuclease signature motif containing protein [Hamadaea sp.]|uniref:HNH endonuclease signature motif containing protein n=1 Tax=Hamadaea sp. TaxID=2024425 RepID=UPI0025BC38A7|nr:HNH endonuclease signature motif containing protein [Hamadaea sp.]
MATAAEADPAGGAATASGDAIGAAKRVLPGDPDLRSAGARRADALIELCERILHTGELPDNGGQKPHLTITLPWEQLKAKVGAGLLDTGDLLTPETVRRLACDAIIIPAVLGGDGQVLDVGRARRLIDGPLRRALVLRDRGCAFPGCDRPPQWCDGHHVTAWADGGTTCLANSVLLCGFHHREIHHGHWQVRIRTDGFPEFLPPAFIDPLRRPVQNTLHRRC